MHTFDCILSDTQAVKCSNQLMQKVTSHNRRTLDMLAAKTYFYHARSYELTDQLDKVRGYVFSPCDTF